MRFLATLAVIAVLVVAFGWWRGWFGVTVDRDKIRQDTDKAVQKVRDVEDRILDGPSKDRPAPN